MRFGFGTVVLCSLVTVWAACRCGPKPCSSQSDCSPDEVCDQNGMCQPKGGGGGDGGDGGGGDGGPDGGPTPPCVNLECQQVTCPPASPTRITGSVYDPSGQVALYNAIV